MSGRFRRFNFKSIKEDKELDKDKKDIDSYVSKDGSITIVKTEKLNKNYLHNKLIINDEDAKIIQDFCRKKLKPILEKKREEEQKRIEKEKEEAERSSNNSERGYFSKYRRHLMKEKENSNESKTQEIQNIQNNEEIYKSKKLKENIVANSQDKQNEKNTEESNNGKKFISSRFQKNVEKSNENNSSDKVQNENEESNYSVRLKRKKINYEEKKEDEKKPKFEPTYHKKKKFDNSKIDNENDFYGKNYKCQEIEVIPVKLCDDYDEYYYPRMRFYSPGKPQYVEPYFNPNIIITKIEISKSDMPQGNIGYERIINNNENYYKRNISKNESFYKNQNLYGRQIFTTQYQNDYKYSRPFKNVNYSRNNAFNLGRSQNSKFNNHELKTSYAPVFN